MFGVIVFSLTLSVIRGEGLFFTVIALSRGYRIASLHYGVMGLSDRMYLDVLMKLRCYTVVLLRACYVEGRTASSATPTIERFFSKLSVVLVG
jgi:hypothetical protein